jgi:alkaline phosphatase D
MFKKGATTDNHRHQIVETNDEDEGSDVHRHTTAIESTDVAEGHSLPSHHASLESMNHPHRDDESSFPIPSCGHKWGNWIALGAGSAVGMFLAVQFGRSLYFQGQANSNNEAKSISESLYDIEFAPLPPKDQILNRIVFGSCINQNFPNPFWDTIASFQPDLTVLGGDNVYSDCDSVDTCEEKFTNAYGKLAKHPSFKGFAPLFPMVSTLDDHDYGMNQAFDENPYKDVAQQHFLDFFQVPATDERRLRSGKDGIYTAFTFGEVDENDVSSVVQIILMDLRYNRSDLKKTMLGDEQWMWLEEQFQQPDVALRLLVSSVQAIAIGHPFECWHVLPHEQQRLYNLIGDEASTGTTLILSGDRHVGGIYQHNLTTTSSSDVDVDETSDSHNGTSSNFVKQRNGKTSMIYEVTSSSFTHTIALPPASPDKYCWNPGGTTSEDCDDPDPTRLYPYVRQNHFALLSIDWDKDNRTITTDLVQADATDNSHEGNHWMPDSGTVLQSITIEF